MPEEIKEEEKPSEELEDKKIDASKKPEVEEDDEPVIRQSAKDNKDYIIERQQRKIKKMKEKEDDFDDDDDDDDDITSKGRKAIQEGIEKEFQPILKGIKRQADTQELNDAMKEYPEAKGMEKTVKKYMKAYPTASVNFIVCGLIGKKKMLDERREKADDDADEEKIEGNSRRTQSKSKFPDVNKMSDEEFDKLDREVMSGKYLPK